MQMGMIPVSPCRMIRFHFELIIKFFLRFEFQENIITIALRTDPEAMGMQVGGIKAVWFIYILDMSWTGCF